jgi:hypothetical protein
LTVAPLLLLAAAAASEAPICTDRPAKANAVCTVPTGHFQLETNAAGWSLTKSAGARTEGLTLGSSFLKLGLNDRSDVEVGFTPFVQVETHVGGFRDRVSGFGDVVVRYKQRLTGADAKVQAGLIPFVKVPTAKSGLGNGKVEGGLALPISFTLSGPVTMTFGPEVDVLADADGHGRHGALVNLVNVAFPITNRVTMAAELWSNFNFDPAGTVKQASVDGSIAYALSERLQLDGGVNLGLTRDTPDAEIYAGISARF